MTYLMSSVVDWGDVPTWVQSGTTLLALVGAVIAVIQGSRAYRLERERDARALEELERRYADERRTQAGAVSAWVTESRERPGEPSWLLVALRNASEAPVYSVVALVAYPRGSNTEIRLAVLPPTTEPVERVLQSPSGHIDIAEVSVTLQFRDSAGHTWRRAADGVLEEML